LVRWGQLTIERTVDTEDYSLSFSHDDKPYMRGEQGRCFSFVVMNCMEGKGKWGNDDDYTGHGTKTGSRARITIHTVVGADHAASKVAVETESGHATAPPSSVMNSRRLISPSPQQGWYCDELAPFQLMGLHLMPPTSIARL
jgi:hypothetical protein